MTEARRGKYSPARDEGGRRVRLEDVPAIDLVVCGSVAANRKGARLGKGRGYSDLEYGLLTIPILQKTRRRG